MKENESSINSKGLSQFFDEIKGLSFVSDFDDTWFWKDGVSPEFLVKSVYDV